jgi:hypothetical protein
MSLRKHVFRLTLAGVVLGAGTLAEAQNVPPAAPVGPAPTLWHYLGLRQGSWMRRDAFLNRSGNRPWAERTPPLKRLADPALADVDNAAIKKAQQIKAEEELAPQKIKAIKYLATLGCGKCYKGVDEAFLESLKDCTEAVRYETVMALQSIPNQECPMCDNDCCTEAITEELAKIAYERDPDHPDCWYEPSARIREAAAAAINVCCPNRGAIPMADTAGTSDGRRSQRTTRQTVGSYVRRTLRPATDEVAAECCCPTSGSSTPANRCKRTASGTLVDDLDRRSTCFGPATSTSDRQIVGSFGDECSQAAGKGVA